MDNNNQYITISITVDDAKAAVECYQKALNAEVESNWEMPDGTVIHSVLKFGNTMVYVSGEYPDWKAFCPKTVGGSPNLLCVRDENCDELFQQAVDAGGEILQPLQNFPWGMRVGVMIDPFGYRWSIGKQTEDLTQEEIMQRLMQMPPPDTAAN